MFIGKAAERELAKASFQKVSGSHPTNCGMIGTNLLGVAQRPRCYAHGSLTYEKAGHG
jgi:hypothetical protein